MTTESETTKIDPDPFVIVGIVISAIGALGTWVQVAKSWSDKDQGHRYSDASQLEDPLSRDLREAIRDTDRLIRLLSKSNIGTTSVLEMRFQYGNDPLFFNEKEFQEFARLSDALFNSARFIHSSVLGIIKYTPERARYLGLEALGEKLDAAQSINAFYRDNYTFGQVLDQALDLLRGYERVLDRISRTN